MLEMLAGQVPEGYVFVWRDEYIFWSALSPSYP
jgi:hypothetical protein